MFGLCLSLFLFLLPTSLSMDEIDSRYVACASGFCLPSNYSSLELPDPKKTNIKMDLEILDILKVDDKKFSISLNMYFGMSWTEHRMDTEHREKEDEAKWLPLDITFIKKVWVPHVFIYRLVSFTPLDCLKKLAGLWVVEGKELFYNQLSVVDFMCPMRFNKFPLDSHICSFWVGSVNYDDTRMTFDLSRVTYQKEDRNNQSPVLDYIIEIEELPSSERTFLYKDGNYSITGFQLRLVRHYTKYLYIYYLPSGLFVIVSWVSFLIPPEVVPGRMALLVTLFLVLINIFNNTTNVSPNTEGMTAISSWMLACIFFVFGALMAYAFILYLLVQQKALKMEIKWEGLNIIYNKDCRIHHPPDVKKRLEELDEINGWRKMASIDSVFLYLFPLMFFVFNLFYWPFWTLMPDDGK